MNFINTSKCHIFASSWIFAVFLFLQLSNSTGCKKTNGWPYMGRGEMAACNQTINHLWSKQGIQCWGFASQLQPNETYFAKSFQMVPLGWTRKVLSIWLLHSCYNIILKCMSEEGAHLLIQWHIKYQITFCNRIQSQNSF